MLTPPVALRRATRLLMTMLLLASVLLVAGLVVQGAVFVGRQYVPVRDPDTPADVFPAGSAAPMAAGKVAARPADASRGGGSGYRKLVAKASNLLSRVDAQRALDQRTMDGPAAQAMPVAAVVASATSRPRAPRDDGGAIVPRLWQARRERPGLAPAHQPRKPHDPGDANDGGTEGRTPEPPSADGGSGTAPSAPSSPAAPAEPGGGSGGPVAEAPPGAPAPAPATPPPEPPATPSPPPSPPAPPVVAENRPPPEPEGNLAGDNTQVAVTGDGKAEQKTQVAAVVPEVDPPAGASPAAGIQLTVAEQWPEPAQPSPVV